MYYRKSHLLFFLFLFKSTIFPIRGEEILWSGSTRIAGMANAGTALNGSWSVFYNPAGLGHCKYTSFILEYTNNFMIPELGQASFAGIIPSFRGTFGVSATCFGDKNYNEQKYSLGYSHALGNNVFAGILIDYLHAGLPNEYKNANALAGEIGLIINPMNELNIGFHLVNPTGTSYNQYHYKELPLLFRYGVSWKENNFLITSQIELGKNQKTIISAGTEVILNENLALRLGASNQENMRYTIGIGYINDHFSTDLAFMHHPILGFSTSIGIQFNLSRL